MQGGRGADSVIYTPKPYTNDFGLMFVTAYHKERLLLWGKTLNTSIPPETWQLLGGQYIVTLKGSSTGKRVRAESGREKYE